MRKWLIAASLVLTVAFAATERATAQLSILGLKNSMVQFILRQISVPGEFEILAERVEEPEDGDTSLVGVTIADADGVWLKIGMLTLNWAPSRILQGEIDIRRANASDVEILRRPGSAPTVNEDAEIASQDDEPFDWPRSPLTLNVEDLTLERVSVSAGVIAGQSLSFDARGAARDEGDEQSARLSIRRTDNVSGRIQLEYFRTFETPVLNLNLDAVETAGGIVAELAGFPADSTSRVKVTANGPFNAWDLRLNAEVEKIVNITGLVTIDAVDRLAAQASLNVTPGEALDPELQQALAPQSRLDFEIAEGSGGLVEIKNGVIKSPFFGLTASGNYNRTTTDTSLNLALSAMPELAQLIDGITFEGLEFEGAVEGPTDALDADGALTLTGVASEAADLGEARLDTKVQVRGSRIGFAVEGDLAKLRLDRLTPDLLGDIGLEAAGTFEDSELTLDGFKFESLPLAIDAQGSADLDAQSADFAYEIRTSQLSGLADAYDVDADGMVLAEGSASGPLSAIGIDGKLDLDDLKFEGDALGKVSVVHDVKVGDVIGGTVNVEATGSEYGEAEVETAFNLADQVLAVSALRATLADVTVEGTASVDLERTAADAELEIDASNLASLSPIVEKFTGERIAGSAVGKIVLDDSSDGQALAAKINISRLSGFDVKLAQARLEADIKDLLGNPAGNVVLAVSNVSHPMARVATADVQTTLSDLSGLSGAAFEFEVTGVEVTDAANVDKFAGTADLSDLKGSIGVKAKARASGISAPGASEVGEVDLVADLANLTTAPLGSVQLEASKIAAGGAAVSGVKLDAAIDEAGDLEAVLDVPDVRSGDIRVSSAKLVARIKQVLEDSRDLDVTFNAARVAAAPATISQPKVTLQGTMSALQLSADASGQLSMDEETTLPLALRLRATADASSPDLVAQISDAWVSLDKTKVGLRRPAKIASSGGTTEISDLDLAIPGGGLTGTLAAHEVGFGTDLALALTEFEELAATLETFDVDLPLKDGNIDLKLKADTRPGSASGDLSLAASGLRLGAGLNDVGTLELDTTGKWNGSTAEVQSTLSGPYGDPLRLAGTLPLRAGNTGIPAVPSNGPIDAKLTWRGEISRFMALVPAPDHVLSGNLNIDLGIGGTLSALGINGNLDLDDLKFEGDALGKISIVHDVKVGEVIGGTVNVQATGSEYGEARVETAFNLADQILAVSALRASLADVTVEGTANVDLEHTAADAELEIDASNLASLSPIVEKFTGERIAGSAVGKIVLDDSSDGQALAAKITISRLSGFDVKLAQARVEADIQDLLGEPAGDVVLAVSNVSHPMARVTTADIQTTLSDLSGLSGAAVAFEVTGVEVTDAASVAKIDGTADLSDLKGTLGVKAKAQASGISAPGASEVGEVNLVADLANLTTAPLGSVQVEASKIAAGGAAVSALKLDAAIDEAGDLEAVLDAPDVRSGDIRVSSARLVAKIKQVLQDSRDLDVTFNATRVAAAPATISQPKITVQGTMSELRLGADASGQLSLDEETSLPLALRLRATADASSPDLVAQISDAWVSLDQTKVGLRRPAKIASSGGTTEISDLDLAIPGGGLTGTVAAHEVGFGTDLVLALTDFEALAATLDTFDVDLPLKDGNIDLKLKADTRPGSASGDLSLAASGLRLGAGLNDVGTLELDTTGKWNGSTAEVQSTLSGPYGDPVRLSGTLPLRAGGNGIPAVPANGPIDAKLTWRGEISQFMALVPAPDHVLSGNLNVDLGIGGTLGNQVYKGSIALDDGQYQNLDTGTILTDLKLGSTIGADGALALKLDARDGAKGTVGADISLGNGKLDAKLTTGGAVLVRRDDVIARVTTDITAAGPLLTPAIKGRVLIDEAEISLVNATPPSVADLGNVRYTDDPPEEEKEPVGRDITLDIKIEAPGRIFVRGRGLDSEWRIDLDVKGNAAAPVITGIVERRRGRLDFLGRNFQLTKGEVRFAGGTEIDPIVDVSLEHERDGFTGRIEVTGNASDPKIGFSSTPQVPEEEVLPRTLFGSSSQSLSPGDAILLVNGLAELSGRGGNTVGNLRNATGLDVLRIDETSDGTAEVNVGKNLTEDVYVGVIQPVDGSAARVEVEVDVYKDLQLNAEVGQGNDSSVGVQWRIDF